eukprot:Clim_evm65s236 gene=Clim_evmTU65s236
MEHTQLTGLSEAEILSLQRALAMDESGLADLMQQLEEAGHDRAVHAAHEILAGVNDEGHLVTVITDGDHNDNTNESNTDLCMVCFEQPSSEEDTVRACPEATHHIFCNRCFLSYIDMCIGARQTVLECQHMDGCYAHINLDVLAENASEQVLKRWERMLAVKDNPELRECPQCDSLYPTGSPKNPDIYCDKCKVTFCYWHSAIHLNQPCQGKEAHEENTLTSWLSTFRKRLTTTECPNCKRAVNRSGGCPHMTCVCGKSFCYRCGAPWKDHIPSYVSLNFKRSCNNKRAWVVRSMVYTPIIPLMVAGVAVGGAIWSTAKVARGLKFGVTVGARGCKRSVQKRWKKRTVPQTTESISRPAMPQSILVVEELNDVYPSINEDTISVTSSDSQLEAAIESGHDYGDTGDNRLAASGVEMKAYPSGSNREHMLTDIRNFNKSTLRTQYRPTLRRRAIRRKKSVSFKHHIHQVHSIPPAPRSVASI